MNTQEIVVQLNEEIARLTKARDTLIGAEKIKPPTQQSEIIALLKAGPYRRASIQHVMGISTSSLDALIANCPEVETYGRGWVKLRDRDNDSERRQREVEG